MDDKDKKFIEGLEQNLDEQKAETAAGAEIEEQIEGREMQAEEQAAAEREGVREEVRAGSDFVTAEEEEAVESPKKGINVALVLIIAAVVLALAAVAGYAAAQFLRKDDTGTDDQGSSAVEGGEAAKPEEDVPKGEEVSIDDEEVRRLWEQFEIITDPWSATMHFYIAPGVEQGEVSDELMTAVALANLEPTECRGVYETEFGGDDGGYGCYDAETVRAKVKEIFGKEVNLGDGNEPIARNDCHGWTLSAENNELYDAIEPGCGGQCIPGIVRKLDKAERAGDDLYIYEKAYMETCDGIYHLGTELNTYEQGGEEKLNLTSLRLGEVIAQAEYDKDGNIAGTINAEDYEEQLDEFRWTFKKDTEGNYVFAGLERMRP